MQVTAHHTRGVGSRVAAATLAALMAAGVAGCTKDEPAPAPTGSVVPSSSGKVSPSGTPAGTVRVSSGAPNNIEKRKSVALTGCTSSDKGAMAKGTIVNATDAEVSYKITIIFTNAQATNVGTKNIEVKAKAKATTEWSAEGTFKAVKDVRCVLGPIT